MKKLFPVISLVLFISTFFAFTSEEIQLNDNEKVKWYTWEEAIEANKKVPKKLMVDVYTKWCHYCKVMDKKTFKNKEIAAYLNEHFYPIKLNAEQKEDIVFDGNTFKYIPDAGRKGIHTLAYSLLDGRMSYPSIVFLNEKQERIMISAGFKEPKDFMKELSYTVEEQYKEIPLEQYKSKGSK